jgi:sugar lactone lactonase YvrE
MERGKIKMNAVQKPQVLLTGLAIGESPRWHMGRLWLSNWGAQEILAVDPAGGSQVALRLPFSSIPFSIDWLPDGRMLIVSASDRPLLRQEAGGSLVPHADLSRLPAKIWNEIVVDGRGNIYVNGGSANPMGGEASVPGIIALITPDGAARQVADGVAFPNGMAVTPDNATLIVAESYANQLTAFDIAADGSLSGRRVWAALENHPPDGICIDAEGAVWFADVPNQCCVRVREGGEVLQRVNLDRGCFACMLGGMDEPTLYMVAAKWGGFSSMADAPRNGQVLSVPAPAPGAGWPGRA